MTILDKIVETKREELTAAKKLFPKSMLMNSPLFHVPKHSVTEAIRSGKTSGVITEFKRRSPSKGWINEQVNPVEVAKGYASSGAAAISVLTDTQYFGGSLSDLKQVRQAVGVPLLRKDFTMDAYQLYEAKANGADIILLIAAILSPGQVKELAAEAHSIGLEVLLEIHDEPELLHVCPEADLVGINNRNLKTFEVSLQTTLDLLPHVPADRLLVTESGILSADDVKRMREAQVNAFLVGEAFMRADEPGEALAKLFA